MAKLFVEDTSLTSVADAIRTKGGTSEQLVFPEGFNTAIANIPSGGGGDDYFNPVAVSTTFNMEEQIKTFSMIDTSACTNMDAVFSNYKSLVTIPQINTSNVTSMNSMFLGCFALETVPLLDTRKVTSMTVMFESCWSLKSIPALNTSNVTNMLEMFRGCGALTIPLLDASKVVNVIDMFRECSALTDLGGLKDLGKAYNTSLGENTYQCRLDLYYSTNLTHDSLMNVINNLYDIKTAGVKPQKLQLGQKNMPKLTPEEIAIATNKGWNVQ